MDVPVAPTLTEKPGYGVEVYFPTLDADAVKISRRQMLAGTLAVPAGAHIVTDPDGTRHRREPDAAVGHGLGVVAGVVDPVVVLGAEGDGVGEVGAAALGPGLSVVELAPGVGAFAAGGGAGRMFDAFR